MATEEEARDAEERFWTGGAEIAASVAGAPRWSSVERAERNVGRPEGGLVVLAYRARGLREGAAPCVAYRTSACRRDDGGRRLSVQHQQTPA